MKKLANSAICVMLLLVVSKVLGLSREILLANKFGTSYVVDAYSVSTSLPAVVFSIIASGFTNSYVSMFPRVDKNSRDYFFSNTICVLSIVALITTAICMVFSPLIVSFAAPGFEGYCRELTIVFVRRISTILPFMLIFSVCCSHAQSNEQFVFSYFCDYIVINIVVITSIVFATNNTINLLVDGYVLSVVVPTIMMLVYLYKTKTVKFVATFDVHNPDFISLSKISVPLGLSLLVGQINSVIDKMFASSLGEGVTSSLSYANRIQLIPYSLIVSVVMTVCFPRISKSLADNNTERAVFYLDKASTISFLVGIPFVSILCIYSIPIIRIVFERGAFTPGSTAVTSKCLLYYSLGIPFYALREISSKALAANLKQNLILKNTFISVGVNIVLNYYLVSNMSYAGLAFATSLTGTISFVLMALDVRKCGLRIVMNSSYMDIVKILLSTISSAFLSCVCFCRLYNIATEEVAFFTSAIVFGISYCFLCLVMKTRIMGWLLSLTPLVSAVKRNRRR